MIGHQNAVALIGTPSDSAPQLVQLRKSKSFGIFDQQDGAVRYVNANFNDCGADQQLNVPILKCLHDGFLFFRCQFAVQQTNPIGSKGTLPDGFRIGSDSLQFLIAFLDGWAYNVALPPLFKLLLNKGIGAFPQPSGDSICFNGQSAAWCFL